MILHRVKSNLCNKSFNFSNDLTVDISGCISMEEFQDACQLLSKHIGSNIPPETVKDMAQSIDINKDGNIDFNEFLEAFRLVDTQDIKLDGQTSMQNSPAHVANGENNKV